MKSKAHIFIAGLLAILLVSSNLSAQNSQRIVQLSGIVVGGDSLYGVPYVSVYVPKAGRGTMTNTVGFFSLATLVGDSVVVSAIGFKKRSLRIPDNDKQSFSVVIELIMDTTLIPTVEVFPYYTEELFKQAFLALQLPEDNYNNMQQNLNDRFMSRLYVDEGMGANANYRYYMQQQAIRQDNRFKDPIASSQLFNPFAWYSAVNSLREQSKNNKKKKAKTYKEAGY